MQVSVAPAGGPAARHKDMLMPGVTAIISVTIMCDTKGLFDARGTTAVTRAALQRMDELCGFVRIGVRSFFKMSSSNTKRTA